jgi:hypothetical protein
MKLYDRDFDFQLYMIIDALYLKERERFNMGRLDEYRDAGSFDARQKLRLLPI